MKPLAYAVAGFAFGILATRTRTRPTSEPDLPSRPTRFDTYTFRHGWISVPNNDR